MGGEPVLGHSWMRARREEVVFEPGFHHPPPEEALEADQAADSDESSGHGGGDSSAGDEIYGGSEEGEADDATPKAMCPFHPVDFLELGELHVRVEYLKLG